MKYIFLFIALLAPVHIEAANLTVNTLSDQNVHVCAATCSLRDAVEIAASGDTINFSVTGTLILSLGEIGLNRDLTINGPGQSILSISGNSQSRIFSVWNDAHVVINDLTLTNGKSIDDNGGAINIRGAASLNRVSITNCSATKVTLDGLFGGAIYNMGVLSISNSRLEHNVAHFSGGGIYSYFDSTITLTDVVLNDNSVQSINGSGGNLVIRNGSTGTLTRVEITNGSAPVSGGGFSSDANFTMRDSLIANNTTPGWGAGLDLYYTSGSLPTMIITNTTVTGNSITAGSFSGAGVSCGLGVGGSLTMNNLTITGNSTTAPNGGAGIIGTSHCSLGNSILAGNFAPNVGDSNNPDCYNGFASSDYNLLGNSLAGCPITGSLAHTVVGQPLLLGSLANNGGATRTIALQTGSPAIDAGDNQTCENTDQRGAHRPLDSESNGTATCDIGAYETAQASSSTVSSVSRSTSGLGLPVTVSVAVSCGSITPTGTVTVSSDTDHCDITLSEGSGSCDLSLTSSGEKSIQGSYVGDLSCLASTSAPVSHTVFDYSLLESLGSLDGWVRESGKKTKKGKTINKVATTILIGDDAKDRQYRGVISFDTISLPADLTITSADLGVTLKSLPSKKLFKDLGALQLEIKAGFLSTTQDLQAGDFSAAATYLSSIKSRPASTSLHFSLPSQAIALLHTAPTVQFRLRFSRSTNSDKKANTIAIYSGDATVSQRPALTVRYH